MPANAFALSCVFRNVNPNESSLGRLVKNNLVALGSAAVLTVYSAGYLRTRSAAQRFALEDAAERRPAPAAPRGAVDPASLAIRAPSAERGASNAAPPQPAASVANPAPATGTVPPGKTPKSPEAAPAPAAVSPASGAPARDTSSATGTSQAADTVQRADSVRAPQWKDGVFSGWGTSRHGDIQASVEIKDGRIVSAYISGCYTRYSCSWISMLPPQVVARQGPEVDFVSGATQSTNAFYYAVVEALKLAK